MSQENVEIIKRLYEMFASGDNEGPFELYDPAIVWDASNPDAAGMLTPGVAGIYHGHDGVRSFWRQWLEAWAEISVAPEEFIEAGDHVLVLLRQQMRGRATGIQMDIPPHANVWTLREGKVVRFAHYGSRSDALEAAGLRE